MDTIRVAVLMANGTEEVEALSVVDVLRRGGVEVTIVSIQDKELTTSHGVKIIADDVLENIRFNEFDGVVIPGGVQGAQSLRDNPKVIEFIKDRNAEKKLCAAMCAGPIVLAKADIIKGKSLTTYPHENFSSPVKESGAVYSESIVEVDGNIVTARGPAISLYFGLQILETLCGKEKRDEVANAMLIPLLEKAIKASANE